MLKICDLYAVDHDLKSLIVAGGYVMLFIGRSLIMNKNRDQSFFIRSLTCWPMEGFSHDLKRFLRYANFCFVFESGLFNIYRV